MTVRRLKRGESSTWRVAVENLITADDRGNKLVSTAEIEKALADDRCYLIVAELESIVVGLLSAYRFPDLESGGQLVYLYDIEVEAPQRNKGFGHSLIQSLIKNCEVDQVDLIWAGIETGNAAARRLFARTGASLESESYAEYEWQLDA